MKSFFKKLAFVMAMAMVVSLAAPAAANAATVLQAAEQDSKEVVTVWATTNVGDKKDLCFLGAPEGWRDLERGWKSSDEAVVVVDDNGLMETKGYGTATVTFEMEGCEAAKVTVIVTEPKPVDEYELAQATEKAFTLTYANDVKYTLDDVQLFIVYENAADPENPIEIKWPIDKTNSKVEKNVITVCPFVEFTDGQTYKVVVDGVEATKTVAIGAITDVVLSEVKGNVEVYANEEEEDDFFLEYSIKLLSNGVDLTNLYFDDVDIEWVVTSSNNDETDYDDSGDNLKLYFWSKDVTAAVQAKVTDEAKKTVASNTLPATSKAQPEWKLLGVNDWAVVPVTTTKFDWAKSDDFKSVPADVEDESYIIVLKLVDSRGVEYVTFDGVADKDGEGTVDYLVFEDADAIANAELSLVFYSADTDKILVDEEGKIGVYTETKSVYYVGLVDWSGDDAVEKYIWADELEVTEGRRLGSINAKKDSVEVVTKTLSGYEALATATVELEAKNQYKEAWTNVVYTVKTDVENVDKSGAVTVSGNVVSVDGTKLAGLNVSTVKVTVTGAQPGTDFKFTDTFTVVVKNPKIVDGEIVVDTVTKTRYNEYTKVTLDAKDVDLNAEKSGDGSMYAEITLYKTSNGAIVGQYVEGDLLIATSKADVESATFTTEGARYIVVKKGDTYVTPTWDGNKLVVELAYADENGEMVYAANGDYTVEVVTVRYNTINSKKNNNYVVDDVIKVTNNTPEVKFDKKAKDTFTATEIEDIVVETLAFTRGGKAWTITADMIVEDGVDTVEVGDYIIIKSVTFEVPIDGKTVNGPHYTRTIYNINVSVKVAE